MKEFLDPIRAESLKEVFISRFEKLILSGQLSIGQKLPSERDLAAQLCVSRPVVHEGLVDLAFKGLVTMKPRVGTVINDYRRGGSLALLESLVNFQSGAVDPKLLQSALEMRKLLEVETARLAAQRRKKEHLREMDAILDQEARLGAGETDLVTEIDFSFHHLVALATENLVYPLFLNTFRPFYTAMTKKFFSDGENAGIVFGFHRELAAAIRKRDGASAGEIMKRILDHGEEGLARILSSEQRRPR